MASFSNPFNEILEEDVEKREREREREDGAAEWERDARVLVLDV